jgi:hypothetical protein
VGIKINDQVGQNFQIKKAYGKALRCPHCYLT